jgi:para-nitrobenzyl esterase
MNPEMAGATAGLAGGVTRGGPSGGGSPQAPRPAPKGAVHSADIEYALGNLATNKVYGWTRDDYKVSAAMEQYFANFIKTGNPNGAGLTVWPAANKGGDTAHFLRIDVEPRADSEQHRGRYLIMDKLAVQP